MIELTRAEEQVMQILWDKGPSFVKELLPHFPDPKPAYNTVSTIIRILEKKGFVGHEAFGKSHRYHTLVTMEDYRSARFTELMSGYFNDSMKQVLSHFSSTRKMNIKEADEMIRMLEELKKKQHHDE
jgi:predicted transcriptional regulator